MPCAHRGLVCRAIAALNRSPLTYPGPLRWLHGGQRLLLVPVFCLLAAVCGVAGPPTPVEAQTVCPSAGCVDLLVYCFNGAVGIELRFQSMSEGPVEVRLEIAGRSPIAKPIIESGSVRVAGLADGAYSVTGRVAGEIGVQRDVTQYCGRAEMDCTWTEGLARVTIINPTNAAIQWELLADDGGRIRGAAEPGATKVVVRDNPTRATSRSFTLRWVGPNGSDTDVATRCAGIADAMPCSADSVTVDLALGQVPTDGDDVIRGTDGDDIILAGAGDDIICGLGGDDQIWGQDGNDEVWGGSGADRLRGGDGDDLVAGMTGSDDLNGGRGNDDVLGGEGDDPFVRGGTGDDYVMAGSGNDTRVAGNGGQDVVLGGLGDDVVTGGPRPDTVSGGPGHDTVKGNKGGDILYGGTGNDAIFGGPQPDTLNGESGVDDCNGGSTDGEPVERDGATGCEAVIFVP